LRYISVIVGVLTYAALGVAALAAPAYAPIPPGYDFPADQATLEHFRDTNNVAEMRRHAWYVFAGITHPGPSGAAAWETWYPQQLVFAPGEPEGDGGPSPIRPFETPIQLREAGGEAEAAGESLLSFVMFNQDARDFIRSNNYHRASTLNQLNAGFAAGTPPADRTITAFPREAMGVKAIWMIVKAGALSVLPVWDGVPTHALTAANPPSSWPRAVVVDPTRADIPANETMPITWGGLPLAAHVVPVSRFYHFAITSAELAAVRRVMGNGVNIGDFAVLMMMHVTTKEIPDWVWATYWWHDLPSDGQFGADRPAAVEGQWRNYLMDVAYSADTPVEYDGKPNAVFNPYLENFPNGIASNCMACHQQARWPSADFEAAVRGRLADDDAIFTNQVRTDFIWAIPFVAN
jgi:hypothetical protein